MNNREKQLTRREIKGLVERMLVLIDSGCYDDSYEVFMHFCMKITSLLSESLVEITQKIAEDPAEEMYEDWMDECWANHSYWRALAADWVQEYINNE